MFGKQRLRVQIKNPQSSTIRRCTSAVEYVYLFIISIVICFGSKQYFHRKPYSKLGAREKEEFKTVFVMSCTRCTTNRVEIGRGPLGVVHRAIYAVGKRTGKCGQVENKNVSQSDGPCTYSRSARSLTTDEHYRREIYHHGIAYAP